MDDWHGADFLAVHHHRPDALRVQLKSRLTLDQKYIDSNVHLCFPVNGGRGWYPIPHDTLMALVERHSKTGRIAWRPGRRTDWDTARPSQRLLEALTPYRLTHYQTTTRGGDE